LIHVNAASAGEGRRLLAIVDRIWMNPVLTSLFHAVTIPACVIQLCVGTQKSRATFMFFRWTADRETGQKRKMLTGLAIGVSFLAAFPALAGGIAGFDVTENRLVLRFDAPVDGASAIVLDQPRRIALDIDGAQVSAGRLPLKDGAGLLDGVRQGQFSSQTARVVLDLKAPAILSAAEFSPDRRTLTVLLSDADTARFNAAIGQGRSPIAPPARMVQAKADTGIVPLIDFARPPRKMHSITVPIPAPAKGMRLPRIYGPNDASRPLVVIDAGHGGHDPGAINQKASRQEKELTLSIAKSIRDELVASGRVRVALTREDDRFLVLQERYGIARKMNADLFISVHADAAEDTDARGATVYTLSETASDREAARLAARENKADIINGVNLGRQSGDVSSILIDLTQRETMNLSANFARLLQREASPYIPFRSAYHRFASLMVLKAPDMPSVLFETGYISNDEDAGMLASREGQLRIARGVAKAIDVHFARRIALK